MAYVWRTKHVGNVVLGAALLVCAAMQAPPAEASYVVNLTEQDLNVVATGSGSLDLTDLVFAGPALIGIFIDPTGGVIVTGSPTTPVGRNYSGIAGPTSFGSGGALGATSGTGDLVFIDNISHTLGVPFDYVSGNPLADTATYDNQTFASLGVTPGSYVWKWGSGAHADSFTLQIGTVPEPSSLLLLALPFGLATLITKRHPWRSTR